MGKNSASLDVKSYDIGLDWVTFGSSFDKAEHVKFTTFGHDFMDARASLGVEVKAACVRGYVGTRCGDTWFVKRDSDGHEMLIATGIESRGLAEEIIQNGIPAVATRLDIAATARCERPNPAYPLGIRENIKRVRKQEGKKQSQIMGLFEHQAGSTGLTLGSRTSEVYGRVYDWDAKHRHRKEFRVWRHEIEFKGGAARRLWKEYRESPQPVDLCIATTHARLDKWHIPCSWLPDKGKLDIVGTKEPTTDEKRLIYLEKTVAPFIAGLIARGHKEEVKKILEARGLLDLFQS